MKNIRRASWTASLMIVIELASLAAPTLSHASKRKCGSLDVVTDIPEGDSPHVCRTGDPWEQRGYQTRGARLQLHVPSSMTEGARNAGEIGDRVLLDLLRSKVSERFEKSFSYINADLGTSAKAEEIRRELASLKSEIFSEDQGYDDQPRAKRQIRRLLVLYPQLEDEIVAEHPEYRPLICRYEIWKHRQKILKTVSKVLSVAGTVAVLVGGVATAYLWMPALPAVLLTGGALQTAGSTIKVAQVIDSWDEVAAGKYAARVLEVYDDTEKLIKKLKKDPNSDPSRSVSSRTRFPAHRRSPSSAKSKKVGRGPGAGSSPESWARPSASGPCMAGSRHSTGWEISPRRDPLRSATPTAVPDRVAACRLEPWEMTADENRSALGITQATL